LLTWGLSLYEQSSEHFIIFSKYKHQNIAWLNFREMAKNVNILEQVISIPEVDHFILALNYHPEIVSFRTWPAAHSSNTRCRISIIQSNLFHQKILSCRIMLSLFFFFDCASLYNLFQMKPASFTPLLSIFISSSLHV
jgi:hypothetical protein